MFKCLDGKTPQTRLEATVHGKKYLLCIREIKGSCLISLVIPHTEFLQINQKKSNNRKMDNTHFKGEEMQNEKGTDLPGCWGNANKNRNKIAFSTKH